MKPLRCAIYTRKSSEEGLEQGFNSLHAQREACEAYVLSQAGEGWKALAAEYDDGGFSGGSMARPGLKRLLADIEAGQVDIVVVYKVDRLTRSLGDFSKIVEAFDARGVSFVSVTQAFNTTSSMGRLTLNMLLSFAQFEREVTGERIRDKIAASKAKGMWMGGAAPLGYDGVERKLVVNPAEAEQVRALFARYLELGSVPKLVRDLAERGQTSKSWIGKDGQPRGGRPFGRGGLYHLLCNPVYRGAIRHRDKLYPEAHPAIVAEDVWNAVQAMLAANDAAKPTTRKLGEGALLKGLLVDDLGNPMAPSHTCKAGRRYHYYITASAVAGRGAAGSLPRIGAGVLDAFVVERVKAVLHPNWRSDATLAERVRSALKRVRLGADRIEVTLHPDTCRPDAGKDPASGNVELTFAITLKHRQGATFIAAANGPPIAAPRLDKTLVRAVALARRWRSQLEAGEADGIADLARREKLCPRHTARLAPLGYLAPDLIQQILAGRQPPAMTLLALTEHPLPFAWCEQRRRFTSF